MEDRYILWGGTGQAKVVRPILDEQGRRLIAVFDNGLDVSPFADVPLLGGDAQFAARACEFSGFGFVVAIGGDHGRARIDLSQTLIRAGLSPLSAIHRTSFVAASARVGVGAQILALAAVCEEAVLGDYCIVNTKASVDHECVLGHGVHVMPGATLAGLVTVGDGAMIGAGAVILPRLKIGPGAVVGAGAVVTKDVPEGVTVVGCPARPTNRR